MKTPRPDKHKSPTSGSIRLNEDLSLNELTLLKASLTAGEIDEQQQQMLDTVRRLALIKALRADDWFDTARGLVLARSIDALIGADCDLEQYYADLIDGYLSSLEATDETHAGQTLKIKAIQDGADITALQPAYKAYLKSFMTVPDADIYGEDLLPFMRTGSAKYDFKTTPKINEKISAVLAYWLQYGEDPEYVAAMTALLH